MGLWSWLRGDPSRATPPPDEMPPPVVAAVEQMKPGRALVLGSGTGEIVLDLARRGWFATGVERSPSDVESARRKADWTAGATFLEGDGAELSRLGVDGPFDLVLDVGAFDGVPEDLRDAYALQVSRVARPGARFLLLSADGSDAVPRRFEGAFDLASAEPVGDASGAAWSTLLRRAD